MVKEKTPVISNPVHWTADQLVSFGDDALHGLALAATGTVGSYHLVLGRCLLAVDRCRLYEKYGCSGAVHYGISVLGLGEKLARALRRAALDLESLPRLTLAAETGRLPWGKLREIARKASPETEEAWLKLAAALSDNQLQKLASATAKGQMPWDGPIDAEDAGPTRYRYTVKPEVGALFERGAESLSRRVGRHYTVTEALEHLMMEQLEQRPISDRVARIVREEMKRDQAAMRHYRARRDKALFQEAKDIVSGRPADGASPGEAVDGGAVGGEAVGGEAVGGDADGCGMAERQAADAPLEREEVDVPADWASTTDWADFAGVVDGADVAGEGEVAGEAGEASQADGGAGTVDAPGGALGDAVPRGAFRTQQALELEGDWDGGREREWSNPALRFRPDARGVTDAQRRELLRRDGFCCRTPGCPNHAWLEVHHHQPYSRRGKTIRKNLLMLCTRCHKNHHAKRLRISGRPEHGLRFLDAQGRDLSAQASLEIAGWLDFWLGWTGGPENNRRVQLLGPD